MKLLILSTICLVLSYVFYIGIVVPSVRVVEQIAIGINEQSKRQ